VGIGKKQISSLKTFRTAVMLIIHRKYYLDLFVVFYWIWLFAYLPVPLITVLIYSRKPTLYNLGNVGIYAQLILALCAVFHLLLRQTAIYYLVKIRVVGFLVLVRGLLAFIEFNTWGNHG
jgi:hypothetical protein